MGILIEMEVIVLMFIDQRPNLVIFPFKASGKWKFWLIARIVELILKRVGLDRFDCIEFFERRWISFEKKVKWLDITSIETFNLHTLTKWMNCLYDGLNFFK